MAYPYQRSAGASPLPSFNQNYTASSPSISSRVWQFVPPIAKQWLSEGSLSRGIGRHRGSEGIKITAVRALKSILSIPTAVILLWIYSIWWGERRVFEDHINQCLWDTWEEWVSAVAIAYTLHGTDRCILAPRCNTAPYCLHLGPPARRSPHLPRSTMASVNIDC
jgi:hypothetical protein